MRRLVYITLLIGSVIIAALLVGFSSGGPNFTHVEKVCENIVISDSPSIELESWLKENQHHFSRVDGPFAPETKEFLTKKDVGFDRGFVEESSYYISFQTNVWGGLFSYRIAYGHFLFTSDGDVVDFILDYSNYGLF